MTISAVFEKRDFTAYIAKHWRKLEVDRYSRSAVGGDKRAFLVAYGSDLQMFEFVEMLRCPVKIIDSTRGKAVWRGFINKVEIETTGGVTYGVSLDSMSNKIRVAHTYNNDRNTTDWLSDADSQAEYGIKELMISANEITAAQADQLRAIELERRKLPGRLPLKFGEPRQEASAKIECLGWYETFAWRYFDSNDGLIEYYNDYEHVWNPLGWSANMNVTNLAMPFYNDLGKDWVMTTVWIKVRKVGSPTDNFIVSLYSHDVGASEPDALLSATGNIAGTSLTTESEWYEFTLDTPQTLSNAGTYWIFMDRSGAQSATNYYYVSGDENYGYDITATSKYSSDNGTNWVGYDEDMYFRIVGTQDSSSRIAELVSEAGQFYIGVDISSSYTETTPYDDGDSSAQFELEEMLKVGTSANKRLLCDTTPTRKLKVYAMPDVKSADYTIDGRGNIYDTNNNIIDYSDCPVGFWARLKSIVPDATDISRIYNSSHVFVEAAEYNVKKQRYQIIETSDSGGIFDFLKIREG